MSKDIRKSINFDLNTLELKKHFKDTREPYGNIKKFMIDNGFEHRQYSGYTSKEPLSIVDITSLVRKLDTTFPWLGNCIKEFDVTDISNQHSLKNIFTNTKTKPQEKKFDSIDKDIKDTQELKNEFDDIFKPQELKAKDTANEEPKSETKIRRQNR